MPVSNAARFNLAATTTVRAPWESYCTTAAPGCQRESDPFGVRQTLAFAVFSPPRGGSVSTIPRSPAAVNPGSVWKRMAEKGASEPYGAGPVISVRSGAFLGPASC